MSKLQMKSMLITLFDIKCTVHFEFIPQCQTVNQAYYVETLKRLPEAVPIKRPELWPRAQKSITEMEYPAYSLDLTPTGF
jgi:hypothetical protein